MSYLFSLTILGDIFERYTTFSCPSLAQNVSSRKMSRSNAFKAPNFKGRRSEFLFEKCPEIFPLVKHSYKHRHFEV